MRAYGSKTYNLFYKVRHYEIKDQIWIMVSMMYAPMMVFSTIIYCFLKLKIKNLICFIRYAINK